MARTHRTKTNWQKNQYKLVNGLDTTTYNDASIINVSRSKLSYNSVRVAVTVNSFRAASLWPLMGSSNDATNVLWVYFNIDM